MVKKGKRDIGITSGERSKDAAGQSVLQIIRVFILPADRGQ